MLHELAAWSTAYHLEQAHYGGLPKLSLFCSQGDSVLPTVTGSAASPTLADVATSESRTSASS